VKQSFIVILVVFCASLLLGCAASKSVTTQEDVTLVSHPVAEPWEEFETFPVKFDGVQEMGYIDVYTNHPLIGTDTIVVIAEVGDISISDTSDSFGVTGKSDYRAMVNGADMYRRYTEAAGIKLNDDDLEKFGVMAKWYIKKRAEFHPAELLSVDNDGSSVTITLNRDTNIGDTLIVIAILEGTTSSDTTGILGMAHTYSGDHVIVPIAVVSSDIYIRYCELVGTKLSLPVNSEELLNFSLQAQWMYKKSRK